MTATGQVGDLEQERDLRFQGRAWVIQRGGWLVMLLIIVAALLGLLGAGPLSSATAETGPLQLQYSRFERRHAPAALEVRVENRAFHQGQVELWLASDYLEHIEITSIIPEPEGVIEAGDRAVYRFKVDEEAEAAMIRFALEPDDSGPSTGRIGVVGGPELAFWQFVYP
jgi:hypothetical protein